MAVTAKVLIKTTIALGVALIGVGAVVLWCLYKLGFIDVVHKVG